MRIKIYRESFGSVLAALLLCVPVTFVIFYPISLGIAFIERICHIKLNSAVEIPFVIMFIISTFVVFFLIANFIVRLQAAREPKIIIDPQIFKDFVKERYPTNVLPSAEIVLHDFMKKYYPKIYKDFVKERYPTNAIPSTEIVLHDFMKKYYSNIHR